MPLPLPSSLSPSRVSSFKECPLAFRFSTIDGLPEAPSEPAVKGTTVHRALELLFTAPAHERTRELATTTLATALEEMATDEDYLGLHLDEAGSARFAEEASRLVDRYFELEDPTAVHPVGLELKLEAQLGSLKVRGVIDRLELEDGELVVTDYKTGKAPRPQQERARMAGVHIYSMMVERVFGRRPARVQLLYLGGGAPQVLAAPTSERSVAGVERQLGAVWAAVERACETEQFAPRTSPLCNWCSFREFCPEFGGDPAAAAAARKD